MPYIDFVLYAVHVAFWWSFGITRFLTRPKDSGSAEPNEAPVSAEERTAPFSRTLVLVHSVAFFTMYAGMALAIMTRHVPIWFPGQRIAGTLIIALGAGLVSWAVAHFSSWRFQARLGRGHELATQGPFRVMRHPIYMGLNLLAFGSAIWVPTRVVWLSVVLM